MTEILHFFQTLDEKLFFFFNLKFASSFLDHFMVFITTKKNWYIPGGIFWFLLMWKGGRKGRAAGILLIVAIVLADQISSSFLKPFTGRFRPCKTLEGFRLLVHCGSRYGFPSSHAANIAAIGSLMAILFRRWAPFWIVLIFLIGFSRIYVGVHYPFDVLGGWLLGILIGGALARWYHSSKLLRRYDLN